MMAFYILQTVLAAFIPMDKSRGFSPLLVIRIAGNILNDDVIASIEYGIVTLGAQLIVVMGHDSCGAIKTAVNSHASESLGSPNLNHLVQEVRKNLGEDFRNGASHDPSLKVEARKNVSVVASSLLSRSEIVRTAVKEGKIQIVQSLYTLSTGKVEFNTPCSWSYKMRSSKVFAI